MTTCEDCATLRDYGLAPRRGNALCAGCAEKLRDALEGMVRATCAWVSRRDRCGLMPTTTTEEEAFDALGWTDRPYLVPDMRCDEPGCCRQGTCGWPTPDGSYRRTCFEHWQREVDHG